MRKSQLKLCTILMLLILTAALVACNGESDQPIDPIAELAGTWIHQAGYTLDFPDPNATVENITTMPNGSFVINLVWNGGGDSRVWLFPAGVEMIRYNWHWERMEYNPYVESDISVWRLFNGDFEVTSCCSDEDINASLFFRRDENE
jgi:hypothetical protein